MTNQLLLIILFGWSSSAVYGYVVNDYPDEGVLASQLISAPIIEIGHVDSYHSSKTPDTNGLFSYVGQISVSEMIKGGSEKKHSLNMWLDLSSGYGPHHGTDWAAIPHSGEECVFFLSYDKKSGEYTPISQETFAIQLEHESGEELSSPLERLRAIAATNVEATNYFVAIMWARFLRDLHDDAHNDFSYWTNKTHDARFLIRVTAYEALIQNDSKTPGLRADVVKCLSDEAPLKNDVYLGHRELIEYLPKIFGETGPRNDEIQGLLASNDESVNEIALRFIRRKGDVSMAADVVHLMTKSKNRDVQYYCVQTLYRLAGNPFCITQQMFLQHPDDYIKEWKTIGENLGK
jgi:hypothetical protein